MVPEAARIEPHHAYNEIVIAGLSYNRNLPRAIEAFVVGGNDDVVKARAVHRRFLDAFGLTAADVPLLRYRPERHGDVFTVV